MAVYGDETPWGTEVSVRTKDGIVTGYERPDGSLTAEVTAAILDNAAGILETKVEKEPDSNVIRVTPGDDNAARDARRTANILRAQALTK